MPDRTLLISYLVLIVFQVLHTYEEIACGVMEMKLGKMKLNRRKYLIAASFLSTLTITPLGLMMVDLPAGYYLALFTSGVVGAVQGVVHTVGFFLAGRECRNLGVGFYSAIPLSITGIIVFVQLVRHLVG